MILSKMVGWCLLSEDAALAAATSSLMLRTKGSWIGLTSLLREEVRVSCRSLRESERRIQFLNTRQAIIGDLGGDAFLILWSFFQCLDH